MWFCRWPGPECGAVQAVWEDLPRSSCLRPPPEPAVSGIGPWRDCASLPFLFSCPGPDCGGQAGSWSCCRGSLARSGSWAPSAFQKGKREVLKGADPPGTNLWIALGGCLSLAGRTCRQAGRLPPSLFPPFSLGHSTQGQSPAAAPRRLGKRLGILLEKKPADLPKP